MAAKEKGKDKDKDLKKGKGAAGAVGAQGDEEEEIIEKKPSAPVELTLMIVTLVVLIVGIYLNWGQLADFYWDKALYESGGDASKVYSTFRTQSIQKIPAENFVTPSVGAEQPAK